MVHRLSQKKRKRHKLIVYSQQFNAELDSSAPLGFHWVCKALLEPKQSTAYAVFLLKFPTQKLCKSKKTLTELQQPQKHNHIDHIDHIDCNKHGKISV